MPKIRSIHPSACESDKLLALSDGAERTLWRLTTHSDDDGRGVDNPKLIAAKLYPLDDTKTEDIVDGHLWELVAAGMLVRYQVDGKRFYEIHDFTDWQKPKYRSTDNFPGPDDGNPLPEPEPDPDGPPSNPYQGKVEPQSGGHRTNGDGVGVGEGVGELLGADAPATVVATVDIEGFEQPLPVKVSTGTLTAALAGWATSEGLEPPRDKLASWLLNLIDNTLGDGPHSHGCRVAVIGEWLAEHTGSDPPREAWQHLRRMVKVYGPLATGEALRKAVTAGAGLAPEYQKDPLAVTKYAVAILEREAA